MKQCQNDERPSPGNTLLKMGSEIGQILIDEILKRNRVDADQALWEFLANLWAGLVLHLAKSTRASHHKLYLSIGGELMTHLWALLSHAGLMGEVVHSEMGGGAMPFKDLQRQGLDLNVPS
uniref:DUF4220 domain-containing protein n=1 Tax=Arundo donax TaxID=35708 RepID=A0A0A9F130_ARUDO